MMLNSIKLYVEEQTLRNRRVGDKSHVFLCVNAMCFLPFDSNYMCPANYLLMSVHYSKYIITLSCGMNIKSLLIQSKMMTRLLGVICYEAIINTYYVLAQSVMCHCICATVGCVVPTYTLIQFPFRFIYFIFFIFIETDLHPAESVKGSGVMQRIRIEQIKISEPDLQHF